MQPDSGQSRDHLLPAPVLINRSYIATLRGEAPPDIESTRSAEIDSLGLEVTDTYTVTKAQLDQAAHYELTNAQGEIITDGIRDSLSEALLEMATDTEGKDI